LVSFLPAFPPKSYMHSSLPPFVLCAPLILLDLIILIILGKQYNSWNSLYSFLYPHVTSSLFGPNIPLSTLFSNTLSLCSPLMA
jgi:hypothetical protein